MSSMLTAFAVRQAPGLKKSLKSLSFYADPGSWFTS